MAHEPVNSVHQAAKDGEISVLSSSSKKQLNFADKDGWTAVHWCAWAGDPGPLEVILDRGGNPDKPDVKGCTPLHIAATYGNYEAIELLLEHKSNIFALDNRGMHAAKVAVLNKRLDCYRLLDSLHFQLRASNAEYVKAQQTKAIKVLEKRLQKNEKAEKAGGGGGGGSGNDTKVHRFRLGSLKKSTTGNEKGDENDMFVLRNPNIDDSGNKDEANNEDIDGEEDEDGDMFDPIFASKSAKSTLRPLPKMTSGAMLQTLTSIGSSSVKRGRSLDDTDSPSGGPLNIPGHLTRHSQRPTSNNVIGTIQPINPTEFEIENDSPLVTFLHSVDAYDTGGVLLQEKMDMTSLMLCSEEDLKSIGIALGPRKRIVDGISKRAASLSASTLNDMTDTDL